MLLNTEGKNLAIQLIETLKALIRETVHQGNEGKKCSVDDTERSNIGEELLDTLQELFVVKTELQEQETGFGVKQEETFHSTGSRASRFLNQDKEYRFENDPKESYLVKEGSGSEGSLKKQFEKPSEEGFGGLKTIEVNIDVDSNGNNFTDVEKKVGSLVNEVVVMDTAGNKRGAVDKVEESAVAFEGDPNFELIDKPQRPKTLDLKNDHCKVNGDCFDSGEGRSEMIWDSYGSLMNSGDSGVFEGFRDIVDFQSADRVESVKSFTSSCGKGSPYDKEDDFGNDIFGEGDKGMESSKREGVDGVQCQISVSPSMRSIPILKEPLTSKSTCKIPRFAHGSKKTGKDDASSSVMEKMKTLRDSILQFREYDFNGLGKSNLQGSNQKKKLNRPLSKSSSQLYDRPKSFDSNFDGSKKKSSLQVPDRAKRLNCPLSSSSGHLYNRSQSYDQNCNEVKEDAEAMKQKKLRHANSLTNLSRSEVGLDNSLSFWRQRDSLEKLYSQYTADEKRVLRDIKCDIEFESYFKANEPVTSRSWKAVSTGRNQSTKGIDKISDDSQAETKEKKMDSSITQKRKARSEMNLAVRKKSSSRDNSCDRRLKKRLSSNNSKIPILVGR